MREFPISDGRICARASKLERIDAMNIYQKAAITFRVLLTVLLIVAPLSAQRRRPVTSKPAPPVKPAPAKTAPALTFETVLAADTYKIYGEVRGVGQLLRSSGVNDLVEPIMKLSAPPKEFKTLVRWLNSHADALMTSRMMFAAWPSRPKLPQTLFVIEFPSAEEAQKFEPQLKEFLPRFLPSPVTEGSPAPTPGQKVTKELRSRETSPPPPAYILKQSGSLIFISETQFAFKDLRPKGSRLLAEEPNFRQIHDRLSSESAFLYFDVASAQKEDEERMRKMHEEEKKREEQAAANPTPQPTPEGQSDIEATTEFVPDEPPPAELGPPQPADPATAGAQTGEQGESPASASILAGAVVDRVMGSLFFGKSKWPDAIGVAITFDADTYIVRALMVNGPENRGIVIPFAPQLIAGPPLVPEAPSILPGNTELMVSLSLDLPLMYEGMLSRTNSQIETEGGVAQTIHADLLESPFAVYEKKLGLKIKEDVLPLFGNELAVSVPVTAFGLAAPTSAQATPPATRDEASKDAAPVVSERAPVIAISIRDREAVRALIPKLIDAVGLKGASLLAQTEKRDDTEVVTFANVVSYAFIGNFLVVSTDPNAARKVVDSYLNHQTLAGDSSFRNSTRWQRRQVLGQIYLSPMLMESYSNLTSDVGLGSSDVFRDFVSRLSPTSEPVTYAISNEGLGPLHELHLPKNLILLMVAGMAIQNSSFPTTSEASAQGVLRTLFAAEQTYQAIKAEGNYGSLDELVEMGLVQKDLQPNGYKIELTVSGSKFQAVAVPIEYGKTGKMSFFIDESGVLRGVDNGGGVATVADRPVQ
jgi:hypothetical protein